MKLGYERLAIAALSAMITTLVITTTARYATEHQNRPVVDALPVPGNRCVEPTLNEEINAIIVKELQRP